MSKPTIQNGTYFLTSGLSQQDYEFLVGKMVDAGFENPYAHGAKYDNWRDWVFLIVINNVITGEYVPFTLCNEITINDFNEKNVKYKKIDLSLREKIDRLMTGEVFYSQSGLFKIFFDENNGFTCVHTKSGSAYEFDIDEGFYTPTTWEDEVSPDNPVLCWVSNGYTDKNHFAAKICTIDNSKDAPYIDTNGYLWETATPVQPKECYGYEE